MTCYCSFVFVSVTDSATALELKHWVLATIVHTPRLGAQWPPSPAGRFETQWPSSPDCQFETQWPSSPDYRIETQWPSSPDVVLPLALRHAHPAHVAQDYKSKRWTCSISDIGQSNQHAPLDQRPEIRPNKNMLCTLSKNARSTGREVDGIMSAELMYKMNGRLAACGRMRDDAPRESRRRSLPHHTERAH